jgi:hypothetical protein
MNKKTLAIAFINSYIHYGLSTLLTITTLAINNSSLTRPALAKPIDPLEKPSPKPVNPRSIPTPIYNLYGRQQKLNIYFAWQGGGNYPEYLKISYPEENGKGYLIIHSSNNNYFVLPYDAKPNRVYRVTIQSCIPISKSRSQCDSGKTASIVSINRTNERIKI